MKGLAMRVWNPLWMEDQDDEEFFYITDYKETVRRMIMAAVNWVENNPNVSIEWVEADKREILAEQGLDISSFDPEDVLIFGPWHMLYFPTRDTLDMFNSIVAVCEGVPTTFMMEKALAAGKLVSMKGWDYFNLFMIGVPEGCH